MGHIVTNLHLLKERVFFFMYILNLFFLLGLCLFYLSTPLKFFPKTVFPKTCFVFPIFIGGEIYF